MYAAYETKIERILMRSTHIDQSGFHLRVGWGDFPLPTHSTLKWLTVPLNHDLQPLAYKVLKEMKAATSVVNQLTPTPLSQLPNL